MGRVRSGDVEPWLRCGRSLERGAELSGHERRLSRAESLLEEAALRQDREPREGSARDTRGRRSCRRLVNSSRLRFGCE